MLVSIVHYHVSIWILSTNHRITGRWVFWSSAAIREFGSSSFFSSMIHDDNLTDLNGEGDKHPWCQAYIRSSIMSHISFKMCQFVLIIFLRDYHYYFDLDIVVLWSCYGVLRPTYTTYQNLCPTDHFFGRLLMSQDISPTWIVLLESIFRIIQIFFRIFPMSKIVLWFDSICQFLIVLNFLNYLFSCLMYIFWESKFSRVFHLSVRSICIFG